MRKRHKFLPLVIFIPVLCNVPLANGQECSEKLILAEEMYRQGLVERLPGLLFPCMDEGFTMEEQIRAYKLMINAYYFDDAMDEAVQTMRSFVELFPDYEPDSTDTPEFITLFQTFNNKIFLSFGLHTGSCYHFPTRTLPSSSYLNGMIESDKYKFVPFSYQAGVNIELFFRDNFSVALDVEYSSLAYRDLIDMDPGGYTVHIDYQERQTMVEFPVSVRYNFSSKPLQPYLSIGSHHSYMLHAISGIHYTSSLGTDESEDGIDVRDQHYALGWAVRAGGGLRYFFKKGYIFVDLYYLQGLSYMLKDNIGLTTDIPDNDLLWNYLYSGRNFSMSKAGISIGYSLYFNRITQKK